MVRPAPVDGRGVDGFDDGLPDLEIAELPRPAFDLGAIDAGTRHAEDAGNVPEMSVAAALGVIPQFAEDHVFGGGDKARDRLFSRTEFHATAT